MRKVNHTKMAQTIALLNEGPVTAAQLSSTVGIHLVTAQSWLRELYRQGAVHVHAWLPDRLGRDCTPVYAISKDDLAVDTPRRRAPRSDIMKRHREKKRAADSTISQ